jgi:hypothetical protein
MNLLTYPFLFGKDVVFTKNKITLLFFFSDNGCTGFA